MFLPCRASQAHRPCSRMCAHNRVTALIFQSCIVDSKQDSLTSHSCEGLISLAVRTTSARHDEASPASPAASGLFTLIEA
jgi:hypothetical protein